ncbi:MAG: glycosyltransferase family 4 protein [Chloroflexi bacterium]|nr:glycosyltransferase family 4 protein [Chloroflexota bacterium]
MLLAFDARTIGDHYPGIGRYAFGLWWALGERVGVTIVDPALRNTRFEIGGLRRESFSVRSPLAQIDVPLKSRGADVYYSPYYLMPYMLPCPAVVTLYDATPLLGPGLPPLAKLAYRLAHRLAGVAAKRVIVLSQSAREEIAALGVPREKMHVCPPGLDPKFRPATRDETERVRQKYDLPDEFWLCFGSRKWHKNTGAAVEAMRGRTLLIVGHASRGNLPYVAEEDLPAVYSASRGLMFPSLCEGFGLPVVEAMACGTPVVCLPAPGVKEAAGEAAVMADDMTTAALAEAVNQLDDLAVRESKIEAGFEWVKRFTWENTLATIENCAL